MNNQRLTTKGFQFYTPFLVTAGLAIRAMPSRQPHIVIACMPKSSSTFLSSLLSSYPGIRRAKLVPEYGDREQELCELRLLMAQGRGYVAQLHLRNSEWTQELIRRYTLTPVTLIRNLADCVVSIRDHIRKDNQFGSLIYIDQYVLSLDEDALDRQIIQLAMPWYLSFYDGWSRSSALMLTYDDVVNEPRRTIQAILERASVSVDDESITTAVQTVTGKRNRLNVGASGRGKTLSDENKTRLRDMIALFPSVVSNSYLTSM